MDRAEPSFLEMLSEFTSGPPYERLKAQYTREFRNLSRDVVKECLQETFIKLMEFYGDPKCPLKTRDQVSRVLHKTLRRTCISAYRGAEGLRYVALSADPGVGRVERVESGGRDTLRGPGPRPWRDPNEAQVKPEPLRLAPPPADGVRNLEDEMVEGIDAGILVDKILAKLDPKYRDVASMLLKGWSPKEIEALFGQNGQRTRQWARFLICQILGDLATDGNDLAAFLHERGDCERLIEVERRANVRRAQSASP